MDYSALNVDLTARGYTAQSDAQAAAIAMNALTVSVSVAYYVSARSILGVIQDPVRLEGIVAGIRTSLPTTYLILTTPGQTDGSAGGMNIRDVGTQAFVSSLIDAAAINGAAPAAGKVSPAEAAALLALGTSTGKYTQVTYGALLTEADVLTAWRQP